MSRIAIDIGRIVVTGGPQIAARDLDRLVTDAVQQALRDTALPAGQTMRTDIAVSTSALKNPAGVAQAIAQGMVQAVRGGPRRD